MSNIPTDSAIPPQHIHVFNVSGSQKPATKRRTVSSTPTTSKRSRRPLSAVSLNSQNGSELGPSSSTKAKKTNTDATLNQPQTPLQRLPASLANVLNPDTSLSGGTFHQFPNETMLPPFTPVSFPVTQALQSTPESWVGHSSDLGFNNSQLTQMNQTNIPVAQQPHDAEDSTQENPDDSDDEPSMGAGKRGKFIWPKDKKIKEKHKIFIVEFMFLVNPWRSSNMKSWKAKCYKACSVMYNKHLKLPNQTTDITPRTVELNIERWLQDASKSSDNVRARLSGDESIESTFKACVRNLYLKNQLYIKYKTTKKTQRGGLDADKAGYEGQLTSTVEVKSFRAFVDHHHIPVVNQSSSKLTPDLLDIKKKTMQSYTKFDGYIGELNLHDFDSFEEFAQQIERFPGENSFIKEATNKVIKSLSSCIVDKEITNNSGNLNFYKDGEHQSFESIVEANQLEKKNLKNDLINVKNQVLDIYDKIDKIGAKMSRLQSPASDP